MRAYTKHRIIEDMLREDRRLVDYLVKRSLKDPELKGANLEQLHEAARDVVMGLDYDE